METGKVRRLIIALVVVFVTAVSCNFGSGPAAPDHIPGPPQSLRAEVGEVGVELFWRSEPTADKYTVFWGSQEGDYHSMASTQETAMVIRNLKKGRRYYFAITAWNEKGESDYSNEVGLYNEWDPSQYSSYVEQGNKLVIRGLYDDADLCYSTAMRLNPDKPEAYQGRGRLHETLRRYDLAERDFNMARSLEGHSVESTPDATSQVR